MPNLVCTGATLQCSMGTTPASFAASGQTVSGPTPAGVLTDVGAASVPSFGLCMSLANPQVAAATAAALNVLTPQPCLPVIAGPWTPGSARVTVNGVAALDDSSQCACTWGGSIAVTSPGQPDTTLQ
jgi:Domain of unknown function (DUF4280)